MKDRFKYEIHQDMCIHGGDVFLLILPKNNLARWYGNGPIVYQQMQNFIYHYSDVIMSAMASQITGVTIVYLTVCSGADQRKHQSSASLALTRGTRRWPVTSLHKGPVTRKMAAFDDVIMDDTSNNSTIPTIMSLVTGARTKEIYGTPF